MALKEHLSPTGSLLEDLKEPSLYEVLLMNDHYTTMEFVIEVLVKVFGKSPAEAAKIMLDVHQNGSGRAGVYTQDIAMSKAERVHRMAREQEFPLRCRVEKVS